MEKITYGGPILIKFASFKRAKSFRSGTIYMNSLDYFRNLESDNGLKTDRFEGTHSLIAKDDFNEVLPQLSMYFSKKETDAIIGGIFLLGEELKYYKVFCMYQLKCDFSNRYIEPIVTRVNKFGDTFVLLFNLEEFRRRIVAELEKRIYNALGFAGQSVEYYKYDTPTQKLGPFKKLESYKWQNEYRLIAEPIKPTLDPLIFNIGDISEPTFKWQSRYKNLGDELESISRLTGLGWHIYPDFHAGKWVFDTYNGRDFSVNQTLNPPVIFSPEFDNVSSQEFTDSLNGYGNYAIVAGQGEGVDREIVMVGSDATGLDRHVIFVDARDVENSPDLPGRGEAQLAEHQRVLSFQSEVLTSGPFQYEVEWDVGDVVTVQNKAWNLTMDSRITEVEEIYEASGFKLKVTFGNSLPTLSQKLKAVIGEFKTESTR